MNDSSEKPNCGTCGGKKPVPKPVAQIHMSADELRNFLNSSENKGSKQHQKLRDVPEKKTPPKSLDTERRELLTILSVIKHSFYGVMKNNETTDLYKKSANVCIRGGTRDDLLCSITEEYAESHKKNVDMCGRTYAPPSVVLIGGEVALAEMVRLGTSRFQRGVDARSFWLENEELTDLDSTLCLIINKLSEISGEQVHCYWNVKEYAFVIFISNQGEYLSEEKKKIGEAESTMN